MKPICLLLVTGTNGAKVRVTSDSTICCNSMVVQPYTGAGICYLGTADLNPSTGAGMIYIMLTTDAAASLPQSQNSLSQIHPSDYYVAGTNTGDKILVTYWVA